MRAGLAWLRWWDAGLERVGTHLNIGAGFEDGIFADHGGRRAIDAKGMRREAVYVCVWESVWGEVGNVARGKRH